MASPFWIRFGDALRGSNIRFRNKVLLGVGISLIVATLSGANAAFNVRKIEASVSFSAMSASPLLIGVISLSESYQKLQSIFDPVMKNCAGLEGATRYLENSQANQRVKLLELKKLARVADAATELSRYEFSGTKIFKTRQALLDLCKRSTVARGHVSSAETSLRSSANSIVVAASMNIIMLEAQLHAVRASESLTTRSLPLTAFRLSDADDPQASETWRRLRDFYRLKILVTDLVNVGSILAGTEKMFELERLRKGYWIKTLALAKNVGDLQSHFAMSGRGDEYANLLALTEQTRWITHVAPDSLFNSQARLLENERTKQSLVVRLQREQGQFSVAPLNIMDVAQRINRNAQLRTEHDANVANLEIAAGVIIAALLALLTAWYLKQAVTTPLEALSDNVSNLGLAMRSEKAPVDAELLSRRDEIGDLANQFARTFHALANARRELQESTRAEISLQRDRLHGAVENMPQGLYMLDRNGRIVIANRRLHEIYNIGSDTELLGMQVSDFTALCQASGAGVCRTVFEDILSEGGRSEGSYQTSQRVVELDDNRTMTMTVMRLPDGGHVVTHEDITEKQAASAKIAHMAHHDSLTGLANRTLFRNHIIRSGTDGGLASQAALLCLDLDRFKIVNDTLGHPVGDALLAQVAERLRTGLGDNCFAARLGGDEFAIYQTGFAQPAGAEALAAEIIRRICEPFDVGGHHIVIGTSIGIAISPDDGADADELAKNADLALYCAKQEGKGRFRFFETDMDRRMRDWHEMEHDLREAMALKQFELHYQPIVGLENENVVGLEALIRWSHPRRGSVSPAEFIPVAEEAGLINELGAWILETACAMATHWPEDISIAVNISPLQFNFGTLPLTVVAALASSGLAPGRLMLEITEGVFLNDTDKTMAALNEIRTLGVHFVMDDFGTGYSSLSYIRKFPFHRIKIDQSFVRGMNDDPESLAIIRAVTHLCHDLGMATTAEGVESRAQAEVLKKLGCGLAQGYFFGRPMPGSETLKLFGAPRRLSA